MARIRFVDPNNKEGELELGKVAAGDLVRFTGEFVKRADDEDDTEKRVTAGEIGEVLEVYPQMPGLLISVPCELRSMGARVSGESQFMVPPEDIVLVVDERDPRTSHNRIAADDLDRLVLSLKLPSVCRGIRQIVSVELARKGYREAACEVGRAGDTAWMDYALAAGFTRTAGANMTDWLPIVMWAVRACEDDFKRAHPGVKLDMRKRRHVLWTLKALADDIAVMIPDNSINWTDQDEREAQVLQDVRDIAEMVSRSTDDTWMQMLPAMAGFMGDDEDLERIYNQLMGLPAKPITPEALAKALGVGLAEAAGLPAPAAQDIVAPTIAPKTAPKAAPKAAPPPPPPPAAPAAPAAEPAAPKPRKPRKQQEPSGQFEFMLELPRPREPEPPEPEPEPTAGPLPETPSKYDVPAFAEAGGGPHEWAETPVARPPSSPPRIPIAVYPGYSGVNKPGQSNRSVKVWADVGMPVYHYQTGDKGTVVGIEEDGTILVDVVDPKTSLPVSDEPAAWNEAVVRLDPSIGTEPPALDPTEMAGWKRQRELIRMRKRREKALRSQAGWTYVTAEEVLGRGAAAEF